MTDVVVDTVTNTLKYMYAFMPARKEVETIVVQEIKEMQPQTGLIFIRLAGLSGTLAVGLGAYGAHVFRPSDESRELQYIFDTGSRYHFFHTLALLGVPLTRRPALVGTLMCSGMVLFCGSCYYHALTQNSAVRKVTPYGGMLLIAGWLAMAL